MTPPSLYERVLGGRYARLPVAVQRFHRLAGSTTLRGQVETHPPESVLARLLAYCLGTPRHASVGPIRFDVDAAPDGERWTRHFPTRTMTSHLRVVDGQIEEAIGPARLKFDLTVTKGLLTMELRHMTFLRLPCPAWLMPRVVAEERGDDARLHFRVAAALPGVGLVAGYSGYLDLDGDAGPGR